MNYLRFILPLFVALYFLFLLLISSIRVGRQIGKNPVVLSKADNAHGLIAKFFSVWMLALGLYVMVFALYPEGYSYFLPMPYLESNGLRATGLIVLLASLVWTYFAQLNMRKSWRVGIDEEQKTELVTTGIFSFSRNPIYLGMMASALGLWMVTPNALTFMLAVTGYLLIQIQVRLEEEFLWKMHGQLYLDYKSRARRFI